MRLMLDLVPRSSAGGELLRLELARAVVRTSPSGHRPLLCLREDQQEALKGLEVDTHVVAALPAGRVGTLHWVHRALPTLAKGAGVDAVFVSNGLVSRALSRTCGVIATANNMLPFEPESLLRTSVSHNLKARLQRVLVLRSLDRAHRVLLHSEHALRTLGKLSPGLCSKAAVVPGAVPTGSLVGQPPPHPYRGRPYFLYLSPLKPYKNHLLLVRAFDLLRQSVAAVPDMLFVGPPADQRYHAEISREILALKLDDRIRYLGAVPRADLPAWFHNATLNLFPSLCETNSLILAEILGAGGALATTNRPPMSDDARGAADLFDPFRPEEAARVMRRVLEDETHRRQLQEASRARAGSMSWDHCGVALWRAGEQAARDFEERAGKRP